MFICFANQKGGSGKSSLALMLGSYLALKKDKVVGIDVDKQRSFYGRYDKEKSLTGTALYEVLYYKPLDLIKAMRVGEFDKDTYYLIDTPGDLDKEILGVCVSSNKLIVPYNYSPVSMESTLIFLKTMLSVYSINKMLFVANNIISQAKIETILGFQNILKQEYGVPDTSIINSVVKSSINIQRFDTLNIPGTSLESNIELLEEIYSKLK
jgi:cellulose biosynthesis protein BcsQ